jgi:hypothetical protein
VEKHIRISFFKLVMHFIAEFCLKHFSRWSSRTMQGMLTTLQDFQSWHHLPSADDVSWSKAMVREVTKAKDK